MDLSNWYSVAKSMHLIGMVSWMAGLFYLVRLMVYHAEAFDRPAAEKTLLTAQYTIMEWKVYRIILIPALLITWSFGSIMLILQPVWLEQAWMLVKLLMVVVLTIYTYICKKHIQYLEKGDSPYSHVHYRAMNEVPTIILVVVVFLAVFRANINWWYLGMGIGLFSSLIVYTIRKLNLKSAN